MFEMWDTPLDEQTKASGFPRWKIESTKGRRSPDIHNLPRPGNECARLECFFATKIPRGIHSGYRQSVIRRNGARNESRFENGKKKKKIRRSNRRKRRLNDLGRILEKQTSKVKQERGKGNEFEEGDKCFPTRKSAEDGTIEDCFSNGNSIEYFMKIFPNTFANNRRIEEMGKLNEA